MRLAWLNEGQEGRMRREVTGHIRHGCRQVESGEVSRERKPPKPVACVRAYPGRVYMSVGEEVLRDLKVCKVGACSHIFLESYSQCCLSVSGHPVPLLRVW